MIATPELVNAHRQDLMTAAADYRRTHPDPALTPRRRSRWLPGHRTA